MDQSLFESPRPNVPAPLAEEISRTIFGVEGTARPLDGERDTNFRIDGPEGAFALKVGNSADRPDAVEMQILAMEHAISADPTLPIPRVRRTLDGAPTGVYLGEHGTHPVQLVSFLSGVVPARSGAGPGYRRSLGYTVARLSRALRGFRHPATRRDLVWDVTRLSSLEPKLRFVEETRRPLLGRQLERFGEEVADPLARLQAQPIHGDAHAANVLVDPDDPERVVGLVDFGDMTLGARVLEVAITAAYQTIGAGPVDALVQLTAAYHSVDPLEPAEIALIPDLAAARLTQSYLITRWRATVDPDNADYILADTEDVWEALEALSEHDPHAMAAEIAAACGLRRPPRPPLADAVARRRSRLGPSLALTYDMPVRLDSADGVWLVDVDGNRLLDAYNNVPHVGHNHPQVVSALTAQARRLTTNTRYLVDEVTEYADRLAALLPGDLSVVMFVNSGSEANDLAYQIARTVTGARGVIVTEHAYHGTTAATANMSPEEIGLSKLEGWTAYVGGAATLRRDDAATLIGSEIDAACRALATAGVAPAMFIADTVFSSDGIFRVPEGYLRTAFARIRAAGGLCVADEVQAGFGRTGSRFWGFAQDGVTPDIVTMGKPMGNGHPMGAVVTTPAIAAEFAAGWHFFSTFAGSPVAAAAGMAVLDVLERERLPQRAEEVGTYLRQRLSALGHPRIVEIRGPGLFIGVETTDSATAVAAVNRLRQTGILVGRTGRAGNVIKIRPPLVFTERHADRVVTALSAALEPLA
jgi:4-aminobutyrate aminotransferase-like enzyme/Ser/Thr protein kinase RdoA (MazF antagonist)